MIQDDYAYLQRWHSRNPNIDILFSRDRLKDTTFMVRLEHLDDIFVNMEFACQLEALVYLKYCNIPRLLQYHLEGDTSTNDARELLSYPSCRKRHTGSRLLDLVETGIAQGAPDEIILDQIFKAYNMTFGLCDERIHFWDSLEKFLMNKHFDSYYARAKQENMVYFEDLHFLLMSKKFNSYDEHHLDLAHHFLSWSSVFGL